MSSGDSTPPAEAATEETAPPSDPPREQLLDGLRTALGDAVVGSEINRGDLWVRVRADAWKQAAEVCRDTLCLHRVRIFDATGATGTFEGDLPSGNYYWRTHARVGTTVGARESPPAMRYDCDEIDIIIAHGLGDFVRRLTFDNNGLDFQTVEQRIGKQVFDLGPKLRQPFGILALEDSFRKSH